MHTIKNRLIAAACGAVVIATIVLLLPHRSEAQYSSPVRVTNTTPQSISVVPGPGGTPFSFAGQFNIPTGSTFGGTVAFTVNASHALVIDQVSWDGNANTGQNIFGEIDCTTGGNLVAYKFLVPSFGANVFLANQSRSVGTIPLHVYCDANTSVAVDASRSALNSDGVAPYAQNYVLSGYLLP